jgi:hypothetical protein
MISHLSFFGNFELWMLLDEVVIERCHTMPIRCRDAACPEHCTPDRCRRWRPWHLILLWISNRY